MYLFYCLFNGAVTNYIASNCEAIIAKWIVKDVEGSGRGMAWGILSQNFSGGSDKDYERKT
jgi:hypothetical protein